VSSSRDAKKSAAGFFPCGVFDKTSVEERALDGCRSMGSPRGERRFGSLFLKWMKILKATLCGVVCEKRFFPGF
jgi:hypothetical protein